MDLDPSQELFQWLATLGIGGILAAFMFHFYRKDMKENQDRLKEFIDSYRLETSAWKDIVINNTTAMAECTKMTEQVFNYLLKANNAKGPLEPRP